MAGIAAISYGEEQDVVNNYGAGRYPVSRSKGKIKPSASVTLSMEEVEALQARTPTGRIQDIAPFDIVVVYLPKDGVLVTHVIKNCQFTKNAREWKMDDLTQHVALPLIVSHIVWKSFGL